MSLPPASDKKWGGWRPGAGRPKKSGKPGSQKAVNKSISLYPEEWDALAAEAVDGSPNREAARRLRASLHAKK